VSSQSEGHPSHPRRKKEKRFQAPFSEKGPVWYSVMGKRKHYLTLFLRIRLFCKKGSGPVNSGARHRFVEPAAGT